MATRVNPTRMELNKLKKRLKTAVRGHKLLKDKQDEMVRQFMDYIKYNKKLREEIEKSISLCMFNFSKASAIMGKKAIAEALMVPMRDLSLDIGTKNIMGVNVPTIKWSEENEEINLPYGYMFTSGQLDEAVIKMSEMFPKLIELAQVEKTCDMLADEIEKTRRRVNALEYVMIPQINEDIKYITMKLEDNDRATITRLMKVKDIIRVND